VQTAADDEIGLASAPCRGRSESALLGAQFSRVRLALTISFGLVEFVTWVEQTRASRAHRSVGKPTTFSHVWRSPSVSRLLTPGRLPLDCPFRSSDCSCDLFEAEAMPRGDPVREQVRRRPADSPRWTAATTLRQAEPDLRLPSRLPPDQRANRLPLPRSDLFPVFWWTLRLNLWLVPACFWRARRRAICRVIPNGCLTPWC